MHAMAVVRQVVGVAEPREQVVGVQYRGFGHLAEPGPVRAHERICAYEDAERPGKPTNATDRLRPVVVEPIYVAVANHDRRRQERLDRVPHRDRPATRPSSAVWLREGLVQVVVDDVEAHVAGARDPDDGVQVRAVVVQERARIVEDRRDLLDALVEEPERRGVREHEARSPLVHLSAQVGEVEVAARVGLDLLEPVARHRNARRVRSVRRVRGDDRVALLPAVREVRAHEHESGQLALRPGRRLQRHGREPRDLREHPLEAPHHLERALGVLVLRMRMEVAEAG